MKNILFLSQIFILLFTTFSRRLNSNSTEPSSASISNDAIGLNYNSKLQELTNSIINSLTNSSKTETAESLIRRSRKMIGVVDHNLLKSTVTETIDTDFKLLSLAKKNLAERIRDVSTANQRIEDTKQNPLRIKATFQRDFKYLNKSTNSRFEAIDAVFDRSVSNVDLETLQFVRKLLFDTVELTREVCHKKKYN